MTKQASELFSQHSEFLRDRAVADDVARERGYQSAIRKSQLEALGFGRTQQLVPALVIPIWSVRGTVESYQLRPYTPRLNEQGKARKYEMKSGSRALLDVHPRLSRSRDSGKVALIADPAVPLFITEGIPKADAAVSINLCCIALLGVFTFRGSNEAGGKTALSDWESIAPNGRKVYVGFDSDVMQKPQVHSALVRLKGFLESRGAIVELIYLPVGEHGEKVGLDDYIAHAKAAGRGDTEIRDALLALATPELRKPAARVDGGKPEIIIMPGKQPEIVDSAERILVANATRLRIFQRAAEVVRVITLDREVERAGLQRPTGTVQLAPVSTLNLLETFDRLIAWKRLGGEDGPEPADCPAKIAGTYLARIGDWKLPALLGVIEAPVMRPDGTILNTGGYDETTGLYLYGEDWPAIPNAPTRAEAEAALRELLEPFSEFPFVDEAARSVFIAACVTALQRRLLEFAPLFGFDAPSQRAGKSLLAEAVSIIATGRRPAAMSAATEQNEFRKAITAALHEGHLIINLDNITHPLGSPDLARALTQFEYADRLLGANRLLRMPTNVLWLATGNNLTFKDDLPSRTLLSRIDAEMERPEERIFNIADLPSYLIANRKRLVVASLTILRAYHVAGRPKQNVKPWGGFDQWSREIRESLVWLGLTDPCATRERIIASDPERELTAEVLRAWHAAFGDSVMLVREVIAAAEGESKQALLMVAAMRDDSNQIDPRRLGNWCASTKDRVIDGLRLTVNGKIHQALAWRVTGSSASSGSSRPTGENGRTRTQPDAPAGQATECVCASSPFNRRGVKSPDSPNSPKPSHADQADFEDLEQ
jgi:hypothetical protein